MSHAYEFCRGDRANRNKALQQNDRAEQYNAMHTNHTYTHTLSLSLRNKLEAMEFEANVSPRPKSKVKEIKTAFSKSRIFKSTYDKWRIEQKRNLCATKENK